MSYSECQTNGRQILAGDNLVDESVDVESGTQSIAKSSVDSRTDSSIMMTGPVETVDGTSFLMNVPEPDLVKVTDIVESAGCTINLPPKPANVELEVKHRTESHAADINIQSADENSDSLKRLRFEAISAPSAATNIGFSSFNGPGTGSRSLSRTIAGNWIYARKLDHQWQRAYLLHLNGDGTVKLKWAATGEVRSKSWLFSLKSRFTGSTLYSSPPRVKARLIHYHKYPSVMLLSP